MERRVNQVNMQQESTSELVITSASSRRLTGYRLIIARTVWLALVIPSLILFIASLPVYYVQIQKACVDPVTCNLAGALSVKGVQDLSGSSLLHFSSPCAIESN